MSLFKKNGNSNSGDNHDHFIICRICNWKIRLTPSISAEDKWNSLMILVNIAQSLRELTVSTILQCQWTAVLRNE